MGNKKWGILEDAEYEREQLIIKEIQRQKQLERMAQTFNSKTILRTTWINENQKLIDTNNLGNDLASINASIIKLNSLELDIEAYESRINDLTILSNTLKNENYHKYNDIEQLKNNVNSLKEYKNHLHNLKDLYELLDNCNRLQQDLNEV